MRLAFRFACFFLPYLRLGCLDWEKSRPSQGLADGLYLFYLQCFCLVVLVRALPLIFLREGVVLLSLPHSGSASSSP